MKPQNKSNIHSDKQTKSLAQNKHKVKLFTIKANILIKLAEERLSVKLESYVKHDFQEFMLCKTFVVLKYKIFDKITIHFEIPFCDGEVGIENAFDALEHVLNLEKTINPMLKGKEYGIYLNEKHRNPEFIIGIRKKRWLPGFKFENHEMVPNYTWYIEEFNVEPMCSYIKKLNDIIKLNYIMLY